MSPCIKARQCLKNCQGPCPDMKMPPVQFDEPEFEQESMTDYLVKFFCAAGVCLVCVLVIGLCQREILRS
jgi:hypothetical protein